MKTALDLKIAALANVLYRDRDGLLWKLDKATREQAEAELRARPYLSVQAAIINAESSQQLVQQMI